MSKSTKQRIVHETGDHYKVIEQQELGVAKNYGDSGHSTSKQQEQPTAKKVYGESWSDAMRQPVIDSSFVEVE
jgi:hypothetical protein